MFNCINCRRILTSLGAPLALGAIALFPSAVQSQIIIINPNPYPVRPQPQSGTFIYGSPIPTPIPVNPVTGKPTIFERNSNPYPVVQPRRRRRVIVTPTRDRVSRTNTIIINPSGQYYYQNSYPVNQNSYFYYDSSGNIQLQIRR